MISFRKHIAQAQLLSPLKEFELDLQPIEYREDPLLGLTSVVRTGRKFWAKLYTTDEKVLAELIESTRGRCFFCPQMLKSSTPKFPPDFIPEGRLNRGEAWLFPNLFAQKEYSAIVVITSQHYLSLDQFSPHILSESFKLSADYIRRVYKLKGAKFAEIGCNYLFTGGASIVHPHLQVLISNMPYYLIKEMLWRSKKHFEEYKINYWEELLAEEERRGERYLGRIGDSEWFLPFAPTREDEVQGVIRGKSNFLELEDKDWDSLAEGLSRVLRFYKERGLSSFNFAIYSGPLGEKLEHLWVGVKIVSRTSVQSFPVNDVWYSNNILLDGFVTEPPEELAPHIRRYFEGV